MVRAQVSQLNAQTINAVSDKILKACANWEKAEVTLNPSPLVNKLRSVYILELGDSVKDCRRCLRNLGVDEVVTAAYYVGSTSRTTEERIKQHLQGFKSSHMVKKHFRRHMIEWELRSVTGELWRNRLDSSNAAKVELTLIPGLLRKLGFSAHSA